MTDVGIFGIKFGDIWQEKRGDNIFEVISSDLTKFEIIYSVNKAEVGRIVPQVGRHSTYSTTGTLISRTISPKWTAEMQSNWWTFIQWKWKADNPGKDKSDWPMFKSNGGPVPKAKRSDCFLCDTYLYNSGLGCEGCPLKTCGIGGLHFKWRNSHGILRSSYASQISDEAHERFMELWEGVQVEKGCTTCADSSSCEWNVYDRCPHAISGKCPDNRLWQPIPESKEKAKEPKGSMGFKESKNIRKMLSCTLWDKEFLECPMTAKQLHNHQADSSECESCPSFTARQKLKEKEPKGVSLLEAKAQCDNGGPSKWRRRPIECWHINLTQSYSLLEWITSSGHSVCYVNKDSITATDWVPYTYTPEPEKCKTCGGDERVQVTEIVTSTGRHLPVKADNWITCPDCGGKEG